jgi:hypothetical protein
MPGMEGQCRLVRRQIKKEITSHTYCNCNKHSVLCRAWKAFAVAPLTAGQLAGWLAGYP